MHWLYLVPAAAVIFVTVWAAGKLTNRLGINRPYKRNPWE